MVLDSIGDLTMEQSGDDLANLKSALPEINLEKALVYCAGSKDFYFIMLKDFCTNKNVSKIEEAHLESDWEEYRVCVHTLKSLLRTLGFENMGDMAENLQSAAEKNDISYIRDNHEVFYAGLQKIILTLQEIVE